MAAARTQSRSEEKTQVCREVLRSLRHHCSACAGAEAVSNISMPIVMSMEAFLSDHPRSP
jgi:hypothetical protein